MAMNLWYRKSVLDAAGLKVPETWSDWKAASEKLSTNGFFGMGLPANKQLYTDQTSTILRRWQHSTTIPVSRSCHRQTARRGPGAKRKPASDPRAAV
jgi:hypothetical protein